MNRAARRRVAITGLGLVCSQGQDPVAVFDAWCSGVSGTGTHTAGEGEHVATIAAAACSGFDAASTLPRGKLAAMDRVSQLSTVAAMAAWDDAGLQDLSDESRDEAGVFWGTGAGGTQATERSYRDLFLRGRDRISPLSVVLAMNNAAASNIALQLRLGGDCLTYSVACASSAAALGEAWRRIASGESDLIVAGGAEAAMPYGIVKAWESLRVMAPPGDEPRAACRPFDARRAGLVLGEGAAALVLEDYELAQARGARIYAELAGYGSSCDHNHLTAPDAQGQVRALRQAFKTAGVQPSQIGYVNAHGTATPEGDPVEVAALREALGDGAAGTLISSTKSMHGHLLGGAGAIEALATVLSLHEGRVPPTAHLQNVDPACEGLDHVTQAARAAPAMDYALSNSFAFGGTNAVLVFGKAAG